MSIIQNCLETEGKKLTTTTTKCLAYNESQVAIINIVLSTVIIYLIYVRLFVRVNV